MAVVVVLGMHRSGTSCLTRTLQRAGMFLGHDLMDGVSCSNLEGHAEAEEVVRINDHLLTLSGGAWDRVPEHLRDDEPTAARMRAFLQTLAHHPVAGWKDPRTTLTFPLWKPHLPPYRLVACVRHPLAVARSLQVRDGWPLHRGLALWAAYNERLLQHLATEQHVYWFSFDSPEAELSSQVRTLCAQLDLRPPDVSDTFNPFLRHHSGPPSIPDPQLERLYERLLERAELRARPASAEPSPTDGDPLRWAQLARIQQLQSELHQQQTRWIDELRRGQLDLRQQLNHQQASNRTSWWEQQNSLQEVQRRHADLHQELQRHGSHFQQEFNRHWVQFHQALADQHRLEEEARARLETLVRRLTDGLMAQTTELQLQHRQLEAAVAECRGFMERMRRSLPFRCRRLASDCLRALVARLRRCMAPSPPAIPPSTRVRRAA